MRPGTVLVESRELVRLAVAPTEVRNRRALGAALAKVGVPPAVVARATDQKRKWVSIPGRFLPGDVARIVAIRGVHAEPASERVGVVSPSVRRLVGRLDETGRPVDGLELALDTLLRGQAGTATVVRDAGGRRFESPNAPGTAPRAGHTIALTINYALQDICDRALADAVDRMGAAGGDIVVMDPHTGAVLALASRRPDPRTWAATPISEPYEPGSTLKPFFAAKLLELGRARADEVVNTHDGEWTLDGRRITDSHKAPRMSLREVIMQSSNIGIVQFASRLSPRESFETLRDIGLGTPTGVPYPAEAAGTLREPARWSRTSAASLAMGYEVAVTPLQLAAAYAAIANGGELLEPALVKEVRDADGHSVFRQSRRAVRRVMPAAIAESVREMLVETVAHGTALEADLSTFQVAGKTGTARRVSRGQGYVTADYTASFVGLFPSESPQYVIVVKIDNPRGGVYYGGKAAAPVSKLVLEAAIAARDAALNRTALAVRGKPAVASVAPATVDAPLATAVGTAAGPAPDSAAPRAVAAAPRAAPVARTVTIDLARPAAEPSDAPTRRPVPDVHGLPLRDAVRTLHTAGFRVDLATGPAGATRPVAGTPTRGGTVVRLFRGRP
jgi:cell division protein FtsI (penicillin-binding protein 3)